MPKLDDVGWCERCLRPFDRPKPGKHAGSGWRVCDDCRVHPHRLKNRQRQIKKKAEKSSA